MNTRLALAASLALVAAPDPAEAQRVVCKDRSEIAAILKRRFKETQRMFGLQNDHRVLELYASPNGSWTAIVTSPDGTSCVIAAGEAWTILPPALEGDPA